MFLSLNGSTQKYLADLARTQETLQDAQGQVGSGFRIQRPSDDPAAIGHLFETQSAISRNQQILDNLGSVKTEVGAADGGLQQAIQYIENAVSMAAQGSSTVTTAAGRAALAQQVAGLQQALVGVSRTTINGRYIFSGDQDGQAAYEYDANQPLGVQRLLTAPSTRVIQAADGTTFDVARTAGEIFDPRDANDDPAPGNAFAALQNLLTALNNNDPIAVAQASDELKAAGTHLNSQLAFYGSVETRIQNATDLAERFQTQQAADLKNVRDADIPALAAQLSQGQVQLQATLSVEATIAQTKNLFNYLA